MLTNELELYIRARFTLIVLTTVEEERALELMRQLCERMRRPCISWDVADGFQAVANVQGALPSARDPLTALEQIDKWDGSALFVLKDFHEAWANPQVKRKLRNVAQRLKYTHKSIVVTTPTAQIPPELRDEAVPLELPLPSAQELDAVLERLLQTPGVKSQLTPLGREKLLQAALGLTAAQAQRVFAKAIVADGALDDRDIALITEEKKQVIRESEALEFYSVSETIEDVGGLGVLKQWLRLRERAFTQQAREYGLPAPKGVALIGIPGTGKSLVAKTIGGLWRLPLLRLDVGALFGSLVGESEERTRRALRLAETIAPCLLWVDEMEKALAHGGLDSGTSTRVFGTILTWMQEKTAPVFVVATAKTMSHITRIRTQMVEQEYLTKALDDLGYTYEVERGDQVRVELPGFLRRRVLFSKRGDAYELVGDFWGMGNKPQEMLKQLTPRYAYHATMAKLSEQGFTLASEEREPNGRVRLLLRRVG
jgi:hypothetical protein